MSEHYAGLLAQIYGGRRWIVAQDVAVSAAWLAFRLQELGASASLAIGASRGTGALPEGIETLHLGVTAQTMMGGIRASEQALDALPDALVARVDAFDPDHRAQVIRTLFSDGAQVAGRPTYGARDPRWMALEDKLRIDALWDELGVSRAPSRNVPVDLPALTAASAALDRGMGVVWSGDNRSGWHGGASFVRWVRTPAQAAEACAHLATACDAARVVPFLDGIPCSIHGIVFPDAVLALRPCEMLVLRRPDSSALHYAAAATCWDPRPEDRQALRALVRRVGDHLRQRIDYRGVFTIDGVMTSEGFRPTELNPRFGAAIGVMTRGIPGLSMYLLHLAIVAGEDCDWQPAALEAMILAHADAHRQARASAVISRQVAVQVREALVLEGGQYRLAAAGETPDAHLSLGPSAAGGYLNINMVSPPAGPSAAPLAVAALAYADAAHDLGIGALEPAPDLR